MQYLPDVFVINLYYTPLSTKCKAKGDVVWRQRLTPALSEGYSEGVKFKVMPVLLNPEGQ